MNGPFTKQCPRINGRFNSYLGDAVVGGMITSAPSGLSMSAGEQTRPGDRIILDSIDALALADPAVTATSLYGGLFIYVRTKSNSTLTPTLGALAFWDTAVADSLYQVTPDESGLQGVAPIAGVFVSTLTKGYSWWIQAAGKATTNFANPLTGVPTNGCPVYAAADGLGSVDVLDGGGNPSFTQVGQMQVRYLGWAEGLPAAGVASKINIPLGRLYRW